MTPAHSGAAFAARHEGLVFEHKGLSMALHYRLAPHLAEAAHAAVREAAAALGGAVEVQRGKMVAELKPAGYDKGGAIGEFMREAPFAGRVQEIFVHDNGATVRKGQPLFRIEPDEKQAHEDPAARQRRIRANTDAYLESVL